MLSECWENEGQNWAKSNRFFSLKFILPRPKQNRGRIFILFKYFLNNLFFIIFIQNVISKFVKVLSICQIAGTFLCSSLLELCV